MIHWLMRCLTADVREWTQMNNPDENLGFGNAPVSHHSSICVNLRPSAVENSSRPIALRFPSLSDNL